MGQKEKLIAKLRMCPKTFTFDDAEALLNSLTFHRSNKGKISGSRVMFSSERYGLKVLLHKPPPQKELKAYQVRKPVEFLEREGLI